MKRLKLLTLSICLASLWLVAPAARGNGILTTLVSFTYTNAPNYGWNYNTFGHTSALVQGDDGNFYGTCQAGGIPENDSGGYASVGNGTVFKITPAGEFTSLYFFGSIRSVGGYVVQKDGSWPVGNLIKATDGSFYGTTYYGGTIPGHTDGTIFQITADGTFNSLYSFGHDVIYRGDTWTNSDGRFPSAGLVQGSDGNFYGTTSTFGPNGYGTVFQLTPGGVLTTLHSFTTPDGYYHNLDGLNPNGELIEGPDGNFYGTTSQGGNYGGGTVFKISSTGIFTPLIQFNITNGWGPRGGLILGKDGCFYGTTDAGNINGSSTTYFGYGTVFRLTTNGDLTILHNFTSGDDGGEPASGLIEGSDGNFYGTAQSGGDYYDYPYYYYGHGTVFQISPAGKFTTLYAFRGPDGEQPIGALTEGKNGKLYGTTPYGGSRFLASNSPFRTGSWEDKGYGTIFSLNVPPTFQTITPTNGGIALTWSALSNQVCQVQYTTNLPSTNWLNLGNPVTTTNATVTATDSTVTNAKRFYRLKLLP